MRSLVIKCTAGADDPERCNQAFTVAAAGVAAGAQVSPGLTGQAAWFGVPGRAEEFDIQLATPRQAPRHRPGQRHPHGLQPVRPTPRPRPGRPASQGPVVAGAAVFTEEALAETAQALRGGHGWSSSERKRVDKSRPRRTTKADRHHKVVEQRAKRVDSRDHPATKGGRAASASERSVETTHPHPQAGRAASASERSVRDHSPHTRKLVEQRAPASDQSRPLP